MYRSNFLLGTIVTPHIYSHNQELMNIYVNFMPRDIVFIEVFSKNCALHSVLHQHTKRRARIVMCSLTSPNRALRAGISCMLSVFPR